MLFREEFFFLSNFFPCRIDFKGRIFKCSEAAYASEKCQDEIDSLT